MTRKGIFDALGAGCIPVVFDMRALSQYRLYFGDGPARVALVVPRNQTAHAVADLARLHRRGADVPIRAALAEAWWSQVRRGCAVGCGRAMRRCAAMRGSRANSRLLFIAPSCSR